MYKTIVWLLRPILIRESKKIAIEERVMGKTRELFCGFVCGAVNHFLT